MLRPVEGARALVAPTVWQRRWSVVWNAGADLRTEPDWLAYHLPRFGFKVVCVKIADGTRPFDGSHGVNLTETFLGPLRKAGLLLAGWGYCYGTYAELEAKLGAELAAHLGMHAFVADMEREFEYDPFNEPHSAAGAARYGAARAWLDAWHALRPKVDLGVTSYGRVDLHRLDWATMARRGVRFCPQAYMNESAELSPAACSQAARVYWDRRFVHPWLGLYRGQLGDGDPAAYVASLRAARTRGFAVYLADGCTVGDYAGLREAR